MATPVPHSYYKKLNLEISRRLPLPKHLKDSLLRILILRRRTLRPFVPADHIFHQVSSFVLENTGRSERLESTPTQLGLKIEHEAQNDRRASRARACARSALKTLSSRPKRSAASEVEGPCVQPTPGEKH